MPNGLGLDMLGLPPGGGMGGPMGGPLVGPTGAAYAPGQPDPMAEMALSALDRLRPKSPNPAESVQRVQQALDLAYKLVSSVIPQVMSISPAAAKDLHQIGRMLITAKTTVQEEMPPGPPPEMFMAGLGGSPLAPGGTMGGGGGY